MSESIFITLFYKSLDGHLTADEQQLFQSFLLEDRYQAMFNRLMDEVMMEDHSSLGAAAGFNEEAVFDRIMQKESANAVVVPMHRKSNNRLAWLSIAAAILLAVCIGVYLWFPGTHHNRAVQAVAPVKKEILPGTNGAILTLADGSRIVLDSAQDGVIANKQGTTVLLHQGQLSYSETGAATAVGENTLTTPRGRQFSVVLPDGTKVWLNAASSLTYPSRFTTSERLVKVTGEAFFEVAKDVRKPFKVQAADHTVEVLGTSFNINAYTDEPATKTTLLEGSVRVVNSNNNNKVLKPGQQAVIKGTELSVSEVETDEVMAWKNGYFHFKDAGIKEVMRALQRWYDIEIVYEGKPTNRSFQGKIQKDLTLSELLSGLERSDVHFKTDHNTLTILP